MSHTYHHRYTLHPEGDREAVLPANVSLRFLLMLQLFTFNVWRSRRNLGPGGLLPILLDTVQAAFAWLAASGGPPCTPTSRRRSARQSGGRARSWRSTAPFSWWRS